MNLVEERQSKKEARKEKVNSSRHRSKCEVGDTVLIKNNCKSKFQPLFGPTEYEVVEKKDGGVIAVSRGDNTSARRHLDDVKQPLTQYQVKFSQKIRLIPIRLSHLRLMSHLKTQAPKRKPTLL